jgi:hypothetical protein
MYPLAIKSISTILRRSRFSQAHHSHLLVSGIDSPLACVSNIEKQLFGRCIKMIRQTQATLVRDAGSRDYIQEAGLWKVYWYIIRDWQNSTGMWVYGVRARYNEVFLATLHEKDHPQVRRALYGGIMSMVIGMGSKFGSYVKPTCFPW